MSDPVTNVDIEDVLSSIRRLVSNTPDGSQSADEAQADRLVLTPSLRVDATRAQSGAAADEVAVDPRQSVAASDPPPEAGDAPADAEPDPAQGPDPRSDMAETEDPQTQPDPPEERDPSRSEDPEIDRFLGEITSALGAQAAGFEEEVAQREDQWEPDGVSGDDYAGGHVSSLGWQDATDDAEDDDLASSSDPDLAAADDMASDAYAQLWEAGVDRQARDTADPGPDPGFDFDDPVIDEDTLRDMVTEIVRQELQGTLGERITRNVRKLVRREIHRALTSQDFE